MAENLLGKNVGASQLGVTPNGERSSRIKLPQTVEKPLMEPINPSLGVVRVCVADEDVILEISREGHEFP